MQVRRWAFQQDAGLFGPLATQVCDGLDDVDYGWTLLSEEMICRSWLWT